MVTRLLFALAFLTTVQALAQRPTFSVLPDRAVAVTLPSTILDDAAVRKQLSSGLTTIFLASARSRDLRGAGRLEVRYELWDEHWIVRRVEFDGRSEQLRLASREALERWWRGPLRLFTASVERTTLDVEVLVLPFSAREEADARAWMSKSAGVGTAGSPGGSLVDTLIGTTISARPLTRFKWRVDLSLR